MKDESMVNLLSLPIPEPYFVSATDQYYDVIPSCEEKQPIKKVKNEKKKKGKKNKKKLSTENANYKKLRILITTYWDYPAVGGLQNYIATLKAGLEKLGHFVDIIAPNQFPKDVRKNLKKKIFNETKQFYIDRYGCYSEKLVKENQRLSSYEMMLWNMNLEKYDIFHAQDRFTANILGRINQYYQKPIFFTPHGFMTQRKLNNNLIDKGSVEEAYFLALDQKAVESSNHIIALCEVFLPMLKKLGAKDNEMTTIYSGIDFELDNKQMVTKSLEEKTVISCISRLRPRKGHKYLFEALALMRSELKNVDIWIVGDGEMRRVGESGERFTIKKCFFSRGKKRYT